MTPSPQDAEHLKLLSIFHYIASGLIAVFSLFPMIHLVIGIVMILSPESISNAGDEQVPPIAGWLFTGFAALLIICGLTLAVCVLIAAGSLKKRKRRTFCIVVAAAECLFMPLGTVLGVFTIVVLMRESVKTLFDNAVPPPLSGGA